MLAIRLMQLFSDNKADYTRITGILGLIFQIRDDLLNLVSHDVSINYYYYQNFLHLFIFSICSIKVIVKI